MWCEGMHKRDFLSILVTSMAIALSIPVWSDVAIASDSVEYTTQNLTVAQVTGIRINPTATGIEVILDSVGQLSSPTTSVADNTLIVDLPNAVLALPDGGEFQQANPTEDIALVSVTRVRNLVRVAIAGLDAPPVVEVSTTPQFTLSVTPSSNTVADEEIEIVVTGEQEGYNPSQAATATRTETPLRDIPASIQVILEQVLEDRGTVGLREAVQNFAGATLDGNYGNTGAGSLIIRGFSQDITFRNGFRISNFYSIPETANVAQTEILRGPASVLYGQVQPGGIVNIVTKQPLESPYYSVNLQAGQFSFYRPTIDLSGPLSDDNSVLYRLNAAYENSGSFRDRVNTERWFIAPVLQWNMSDRTSLTFDFEYLYDDPVFDRGIVTLSDGSFVLPINRFLGYPQLDDFATEVYRGGLTFEHQFSGNWRMRNALSISSIEQGGARSDLDGGLIDDQFIPRQLRDDNSIAENYGFQTDIIGNFATGTIEHQLLLGFDFNRVTDSYKSEAVSLPPLDIFNPVYDIDVPTELEPRYSAVTRTNALGLYLQDQIALLDNVKLLVGGRFDFTEQNQTIILDDASDSQSDTAFSPRVGIVYQPIEPISLYASFSRSFLPVIGRAADNSIFEPERGTQYEVGIKADLATNLSATLAAYHLTKTNVLTTDLNDPDFSIQVGEQRSQGIELNVAGEILPGWNVIAAYAYTDAEVTEDNELPVGSRLANVAENTASLWTTYEIKNGNLQGLGFGLGLLYVGDRPGSVAFDPPDFRLPSYLRTDIALFYRRNNWRAQINVQNLFNIEYYQTAQGYDIVYPGAPLNIVGSVSFEF